jgi:serine/threonine protein kinase
MPARTTVIQPPEGGWPQGVVEGFFANLERVRGCRHAGIAAIEAQKEADGSIVVRQDVAGTSLRERRDLDAASLLRVVNAVCEALMALHRAGALHLGVSTETVFVDGQATQLTDSGLALLRGGGGDVSSDVAAATSLAGELFRSSQLRTGINSLEDLQRDLSLAAGIDATEAQPNSAAEAVLPEGAIVAEKYRIIRSLGSGGMGHVYEAEHRILSGKRVALKILRAEVRRRPGMEARFLQEARVAAELRHPHIVHVEDVDIDPQLGPVMVMELLPGTTVERRLRVGRLPPAECRVHALQALEALEFAHSRGVVHRDVKPANLFLAQHGEARSLKLLDFGIANNGQASDGGEFEGTPRYASPEQLGQRDHVGQESDVYSLGVTLFEMMTGEHPMREEREPARLRARMEAVGIDAPTRAAVARACEADRVRRFAAAREVREALAPRRRPRVALAALAAAMLAVLGVVFFWPSPAAKPSSARSSSAMPSNAMIDACELFARSLAASQRPDGSFAALVYNRPTGGETAQVLYALLTAQPRCHAPDPSVTVKGLAALERMRSPRGWSWQSLDEHRLYDSPTATAWAVLALTEAARADASLRPRLVTARDLLVQSQLADGGFPQSIGGDSLVQPAVYATVLSLFALVEAEAVETNPAATAARKRAAEWVTRSLRVPSDDSVRAVAGLEEQVAWVLRRAGQLDDALAGTLAADLLSRCSLKDGSCRPSLSRNGKLLVQTRQGQAADVMVMFWNPWARLAAAALRDEPLLPAATRAQLGETVASIDAEVLAAPSAIAAKDAFELAEYLIAAARSIP